MSFNSNFSIQELTQKINRVVETEYPDLLFLNGNLISIDTSLNPFLQNYTYETFEASGLAKHWRYGDKMERVSMGKETFRGELRHYALEFAWNEEQLQIVRATGNDFISRGLASQFRGHEMKLDSLIQIGDPAANGALPGLFNHPLVGSTALPNGVSLSPQWASKTGLEIYQDLTFMASFNRIATENLYPTTVLLLPHTAYQRAQETFVGVEGTRTAMETFIENERMTPLTGVQQVIPIPALDQLGIAVAYNPMEEYIRCHVPRRAERQPQFQHSATQYSIGMISTFGGVQIDHPLSVRYFTGIV